MLILRYSVIFLVIAIIAAAFGFAGVVSMTSSIARALFFLFLVLFVGGLAVGHIVRKKK